MLVAQLWRLAAAAAATSLASAERCQPTWLDNRDSHEPTDVTQNAGTLLYLAAGLEDMADLDGHIDALAIPRDVGTLNHALVEDHIETTMIGLGWTIERDEFDDVTPEGNKTFTNILAHSNPDSPRRLVIACHYETAPTIDASFVGAIDSAAPCALSLNLATTLNDIIRERTVDEEPELGVTLLFFDGEEAIERWTSTDSLYGSRHLALDWDSRPFDVSGEGSGFCQTEAATFMDRMDLLFLMDLLGAEDMTLKRFNFQIEEPNPYYGNIFEIETALDEVLLTGEDRIFTGQNAGTSISDDHQPFLGLGMNRIFYLLQYPFPRQWHKVSDTKDNLQMSRIYRLAQLIRVWTAQYLRYEG